MMRRVVLLLVALLVPATGQAQETLDIGEIYLGTQPCRMLSGSGSPESSVTAEPCSVYLRTSDGTVWRKASGSGNTGWEVIGLPSGGDEGEVLYYGGSGAEWSADPTVDTITLDEILSDGDLELNPTGNDVLPKTAYTRNLGAFTRKWLTLHAAELWVSTLVAQDVMSTIGGRVVVAPTTELTADLAAAGTSISVKHNNLASGDRLFLEGNGQYEAMAVTSGSSGSGPYTYSVTRNLDSSGANDWPAGSAVLNTGTTGDGMIDLYADNGLVPGSTQGPTIVGNVRTGTTYSDLAPRWALGNLNGLFGYGTDTYGAAFGDASNAWLKIDATNGVRIGHGSTTLTEIDASGNASFTGTVYAGAGEIGEWAISNTRGAVQTPVGSTPTVGLYGSNVATSSIEKTSSTTAIARAFSSSLSDLTMGVWVLLNNTTGTQYAMSVGAYDSSTGGTNSRGYALYLGSGNWNALLLRPDADGGLLGVASGVAASSGVWTHLVLRRSGSTWTIFVNGTAANTSTTTPTAPTDGAISRLSIGGLWVTNTSAYASGLNGRMAHAFWTAQALTDTQIAAMYNGGPSGAGLAPFLVSAGDYEAQSPTHLYYPLQSPTNLATYLGASAFSVVGAGSVVAEGGPTVVMDAPRVEVGSGTSRAALVGTSSGSDVAIFAGATYAGRSSAPLRITAAGALTATSANISGVINASSGSFTGTVNATSITTSSGTIAGLTLASGSMTATNLGVYSGGANTARVQVGTGSNAGGLNSCNAGSDIGFWVGATHADRASAPFRIECDGSFRATDAWLDGTFETDYIVISNSDGITFDNASSDGDTARSINWQNGSRIWTRSSPNSLTIRGPQSGTYSQLNLYTDHARLWGGAGSYGVYLDQTQFAPDGTLNLGSNGDPWNHVYSAGYTTTSDQRKKDLLGRPPASLAAVRALSVERFRFTPESGLDAETERVGFVAQNVRELLPYAVEEAEDGTLGVDIVAILAASVQALQELAEELDALKKTRQVTP